MVAAIVFLILILHTINFCFTSSAVYAKVSQNNRLPYYHAPGKEGWWWYHDPAKLEKKEEEKEKTVTKTPEAKTPDEPFKPLKDYTYEELLYMHPDEFSKLYEYYLKKAVQKPTEESVYEFYNLADVARKKALLFSHLAGYIWQKYPELSTERDVPIVGPGITGKKDLIKVELQNYARKNATEYGYIVFTQPGCQYCDIQLRILKFAESDGIPVKVVDISKNPVAQAKFGISVTPTIIVVDRKTGQYMPISSGVISLDEIYTRTARAIRIMNGESPELYGIYEFQKGSSLDPTVPPPLWRKEKK